MDDGRSIVRGRLGVFGKGGGPWIVEFPLKAPGKAA
jgi:hypothetical protein